MNYIYICNTYGNRFIIQFKKNHIKIIHINIVAVWKVYDREVLHCRSIGGWVDAKFVLLR